MDIFHEQVKQKLEHKEYKEYKEYKDLVLFSSTIQYREDRAIRFKQINFLKVSFNTLAASLDFKPSIYIRNKFKLLIREVSHGSIFSLKFVETKISLLLLSNSFFKALFKQ